MYFEYVLSNFKNIFISLLFMKYEIHLHLHVGLYGNNNRKIILITYNSNLYYYDFFASPIKISIDAILFINSIVFNVTLMLHELLYS